MVAACGLHGQAQILHVDFENTGGDAPSRRDADDGVQGPYAAFQIESKRLKFELGSEVGPELTLAVWVRADAWPAGDNEQGFGKHAPPTLLGLAPQDDSSRMVNLRVRKGRPELIIERATKQFGSISADDALPTGQWTHVAAVFDGQTATLFIDGQPAAQKRLGPPYARAVEAEVGGLGARRLVGDLDEAMVFDVALSHEQIAALAQGEVPEPGAAEPQSWSPRDLPQRYQDRQLRVVDEALVPLAEGLSGQAEWVPWTGDPASGMLIRSFAFNAQLRLLTEPTWEPERDRLVYKQSQHVQDTAWADQLGGGPYWTVPRSGGTFDLLSEGSTAGMGRGTLVLFPNVGEPGRPAFGPPQRITLGGYEFPAVVPDVDGRPIACHVGDLDGDGTNDLLFVKLQRKQFPDGVNFWTHRATRYAGKGRSYAANGAYLADHRRAEFFWARGERDDRDRLSFSAPLLVVQGREDFPLMWKGPGHTRATVIESEGQRYIVMFGSLVQLLAVPFEVEGDVIRCGAAEPLLADGAVTRTVYLPHHLSVTDLEGDGRPEILVSGNPGSVAVLHGPRVGAYREAQVMTYGGAVRMKTLVVPQRLDWDGDGTLDLLLADAFGWFMLWPGTDDPMVYGSPQPLTVNGQPFRYETAVDASIQGLDESSWGYVNPLATDWDGDGTLDLLFGETGSQLNFSRGQGGLALDTPQPLRTPDGRVWQIAWRQRPAVVPSADATRKVLLIQDWDGDLALAHFEAESPLVVRGETKLRYTDGQAMRVSGPGGFWGRGKPTVVDWDADGDWDIVYGGHGGNHRYVDPAYTDLKSATPIFFENVGNNHDAHFARPVLLTLNGQPIQLGKHVAAVWPTHLDSDDRLDLIAGTDDGKVYAFTRHDLQPVTPQGYHADKH